MRILGRHTIQSITHGGSCLLFNITFFWVCHILAHCRSPQAPRVLPLTWSVECTHPTQLHVPSSPTRGKGQQWTDRQGHQQRNQQVADRQLRAAVAKTRRQQRRAGRAGGQERSHGTPWTGDGMTVKVESQA